jgi:hypothetical protein
MCACSQIKHDIVVRRGVGADHKTNNLRMTMYGGLVTASQCMHLWCWRSCEAGSLSLFITSMLQRAGQESSHLPRA